MSVSKVKFYNDIHGISFSKHDEQESAVEALCQTLDEYKEQIRESGVSHVNLTMTYLTENDQVALERLSLQPPNEYDKQYTVHGDGMLVEALDKPNGLDLFYRLRDASFIGITDEANQDGFQRYQAFDPCEDNGTITLELNE